jgi:hypothetical protein
VYDPTGLHSLPIARGSTLISAPRTARAGARECREDIRHDQLRAGFDLDVQAAERGKQRHGTEGCNPERAAGWVLAKLDGAMSLAVY